MFGAKRYFICKGNTALFVPLNQCKPDTRFQFNLSLNEIPKPPETYSGETRVCFIYQYSLKPSIGGVIFQYESAGSVVYHCSVVLVKQQLFLVINLFVKMKVFAKLVR